MEWLKRADCQTIEDVVRYNTGMDPSALRNSALEDPQRIDGLYAAAEHIIQAIKDKTPIVIVGDYDSDGLNATAILCKLLGYYSVTPYAIIPRRVSDGYGLSEGIVDKIPEKSMVVTIDNGIVAVDQVVLLHKKDCKVVIMDHHLPGTVVPAADVVVDPHVEPEKNGFLDYCGAGLGLQLARLMLDKDLAKGVLAAKNLLCVLTVHAAIATVTDIVPLVGCNRAIVQQGLALLRDKNLGSYSPGIAALMLAAKVEYADEDAIAYKLGPIINAPARLYDGGGTSVLKAFMTKDFDAACQCAEKMVAINNERKDQVAKHMTAALAKIEDSNPEEKPNPLLLTLEGVPEGIIGILAGQLADLYQRTTFVFTRSDPKETVFKGSARAYGDDDVSAMLDAIRPLTESCGGHKGAAGLSIRKENLKAFADTLGGLGLPVYADITWYYDLELSNEAVAATVKEQAAYAPFGEKNEAPVYLIRGVELVQEARVIGAKGDAVKFSCPGYDVLGFGLAKKYAALGKPMKLDILCTLGENHFRGVVTPQAMAVDIRVCEEP